MNIKGIILTIGMLALSLPLLLQAGPRNDLPDRSLQITALPPLCESMGEYNAMKCKNLPQIKKLRCDDIKPPPQHWGGLKPHLAMAICWKLRGSATGPAVRYSGCSIPVREQYIVLVPAGKKEKPQLIESHEDFRQFFAPIETPREAISYISALTGSYPKYEFAENYFIRDMNENGKYIGGKVGPTEVVEKKDGWHVKLFDHTRCGCHRPELYEIEYVVSRNGYIKEKKRKIIWQAHRNYQICID